MSSPTVRVCPEISPLARAFGWKESSAAQGLFLDVTDKIAALPYKDSLAPSHMKLGTLDARQYTLPHTLDLSVWFWNKDLYEKAGLDPERGPKTLKEFAEQATTIQCLNRWPALRC
ncbi:extracellular solute-binding protein [Nonomuraea sp. B12E4]|uniref:extracellular solute-binding protein n=1 Tax=Nonomuraea sp. B12E4 TaxID=3153564 RepID=UPI00325EFB45